MPRLLALCFVLAASPLTADDWPHWRGPNHDGVSAEKDVPSEWGEDKNVLWKLKLPGMGGSTPVVSKGNVFLTAQDGDRIVALAVSTEGKELWKKPIGWATKAARSDEGNGATATASCDGERVYAFAGSGELVAFDYDGKQLWKLDLQEQYGKFKIQFGMHSTPVLHDNALYLALIHSGGATLAAIDAQTGKERWKAGRKSDGYAENEHSYASPTIWKGDGDAAYLVVHGNDYATGHSLKDGSELWRVGDLNPKAKYNPALRFVASPVATKDLIVIPTAKGGPVVGLDPKALGQVNAGGKGELWRRTRDTPDVPSPLVHGGLVYLCREDGRMIVLDAKTGEQKYEQRTHNARYRASPVYADGKVYILGRDGVATVIKAGPTYEKVAENRLKDDTAASIAISDGKLYIRGYNSLYCIGEKK